MEERRMKLRIVLVVGALALLVVPQVSAANGNKIARKAATAACQAEAKEMGRKEFRAAYGKRAMRACVRAVMPEAKEIVANAAQECRTEREADKDAFREKYGTNGNKRNAFGKCVSKKTGPALEEAADAATNAAQSCRAEMKADPQAFVEKYGTNGNKRNAFGKCVAQKAKESDEEQEEEEKGPETPPAPPAP
jgi:hypothetical protein